MPTHDRAIHRGQRRGRQLVLRLGGELLVARLTAGLSQRQVGRMVGVSHTMIGRIERGELRTLSIEIAARIASVLGLALSVGLYPAGPPVRDKAHLALIERLRVRVSPNLRWRTEVPVPIAGDLRSADIVITSSSFGILGEAETRLYDVQALERRIGGKQRHLGLERVILLLADTATNRRAVASLPELARRFPISARSCLAALAEVATPGATRSSSCERASMSSRRPGPMDEPPWHAPCSIERSRGPLCPRIGCSCADRSWARPDPRMDGLSVVDFSRRTAGWHVRRANRGEFAARRYPSRT